MKLTFFTIFLALLTNAPMAVQKEYTFAVVPKEQASPFFLQSKYGCLSAAAAIDGVTCIYRGPLLTDPRAQDQIISDLIDEGVDGIAVAVARSENLARSSMLKAKNAGIPVITYDADFGADTLEQFPDIRLAYVGTDNFELGRMLGEEAKKLRPSGGDVVIQTGRPDTANLNLRIMGIRTALSGKTYEKSPGEPLTGENGWSEVREPFACFGNYERAVQQVGSVLAGRAGADTYISIGGLAQFLPDSYRAMVTPYREKLDNKEVVLVFGDTGIEQLAMLSDRLSHGNIGQKPYIMGEKAIQTLYKIVSGQGYKKQVFTPLTYCDQNNHSTCTH